MNKIIWIPALLILLISMVSMTSNTSPVDNFGETVCMLPATSQPTFAEQVGVFFSSLLKTESWPARWNCGIWTPFHGWMYIISDATIWLSYFAIPLILTLILRKKKMAFPFRNIVILFVSFILACGLTHLIDAIIFYWPAYRLSALLRMATAIVSVSTVFALTKVMPKLMEYKDPDELEAIVKLRTAELLESNKRLADEILQREHAESKVAELNQLLIKFKDAVSKVSIISVTDNKGIIKEVNGNFERISGFDAKELIGHSHNIINSNYHPREFWTAMWKTVSNNMVWREEVKNKTKNGEYYWVDTSIIPIQDEATGRIKEYLSVRNEITQRKEAELQLMHRYGKLEEEVQEKEADIKESEERFNTALENSPIGMAIVNLDGKLLKVNRALCDFTGYTREDLLNKSFQKIAHPEDSSIDANYIKELVEGKRSAYNIEKRYIHHGGNVIWVQLHAALVRGRLNEPLYLILQILDINERKKHDEILNRKTEELQLANKELESFSYSVSHDLRAPLRSINGYAEVLREDYSMALDEEGRKIVAIIDRNSKIMGQLIDDLLSFSRLGRHAITKVKVDMYALVKSVSDEMIAQYPERNIQVTILPLEHIQGDPQMLRQVWINLISNAIKYTRPMATAVIEMGCYREGINVTFYIKDNGVGFNETYKHKLFGVFQRLHKNEEFEGTGVGLAIVDRIVSKHGGSVAAQSTSFQGATFYITFPIIDIDYIS